MWIDSIKSGIYISSILFKTYVHTARAAEESTHVSSDGQDAPKLFITEHGDADGETSKNIFIKVARLHFKPSC